MIKADIKKIILEEIENAINNMTSNLDKRDLVDPLTTILSIPDNDEEEYSQDSLGEARKSETWKVTPKMDSLLQHFVGKTGVEGLTDAMARISQVLTRTQNVGFKSRAKKYQKRFFTDEKGNVDMNKLREFAELILNPEGFSQKDIQMFVGLKNSAQANAFKMKLYRAKLIDVVQTETGDDDEISESKKNLEFDFSQVETPEKLPIDVDEQDLMDNIKMELKSSADDYQNDDDPKTAQQLKNAVNWVDKNKLTGKVTIGEIYSFLTEFHKQLPGDDKMFLHEPTILELVEDEFKPYVDTEEEYQKIVSSVKQYLSSKRQVMQKKQIKEIDMTNLSAWDVIVGGGLFELGKNAFYIVLAIGIILIQGIGLGAWALIKKIRQLVEDRRLSKGAKEAQDFMYNSNTFKELKDTIVGISKGIPKIDMRVKGAADTKAFFEKEIKNLKAKKRELAVQLLEEANSANLSDEAMDYLLNLTGEGGKYISKYDRDAYNKQQQTPNTMSELEKYIKQQIREAKNPLAQKMREIENQGRTAALETKLAAIAEMIEETNGRLTRIDEDNEFADMMDKNAVKEVRKQLKELERAQAKLQKEYDKAAGGRKKERVVDEVDADKLRNLAGRQDTLDQEVEDSVKEVSLELEEGSERAAAEIIQDFTTGIRGAEKQGDTNTANKLAQSLKRELEMIGYDWKKDPSALELLGDFVNEKSYKLNESMLRMQKLAGLITETSVYARTNKIGMMTGEEIIKHYENDIINPGLDFILKNMRIMQKVAKGESFKYKIFPGNTAYYAYFEDNFLKRKLPKHVQDDRRTYKTLKAYFDKAIAKQIKAGEELASREDKS